MHMASPINGNVENDGAASPNALRRENGICHFLLHATKC